MNNNIYYNKNNYSLLFVSRIIHIIHIRCISNFYILLHIIFPFFEESADLLLHATGDSDTARTGIL